MPVVRIVLRVWERFSQSKSSKTILILTLVFTICNSCSFSFWLTVCLNTDDPYLSLHNVDWIYVTGVLIPFLNSAVSPAILIPRGYSIRADIKGVFQMAMFGRGPRLIKSKSSFATGLWLVLEFRGRISTTSSRMFIRHYIQHIIVEPAILLENLHEALFLSYFLCINWMKTIFNIKVYCYARSLVGCWHVDQTRE